VLGTIVAFCAIPYLTVHAQEYVLEELVIEQGADTASLDPHQEVDMATARITQNIFDSLFRRGLDAKIHPHLAESYKVIDPVTWEFKLRKGVKFHNGEDFNAAAVKFSLERGRDKTIKPPLRIGNYHQTFKAIEIVDPHTVRIITKEPDPIVLNRLCGWLGVMLPPEYIKKNGQDILKKKPVGSGPLKFVRWDKDERIVLETNEKYWGPIVKAKRVIFKPIPEVTTRIADLELGRAHIITEIPPDLIPQLKKNPSVKIESDWSKRNIHIILNPLIPGPIADKRVRQALQYAVDVDFIIKHVLAGQARRIASLFIPESFGYDPSNKPYPYDPEKAKQLLAEAGYPKGFDIDFDVPSGRYLNAEEVAQAIAGQLAQIGIKAKIQKHEWGGYVKRWRAHKFSPLALIGAGDEMLDCDQLLTSRLITNANYGGFYSNPRMDELILMGRKTVNTKEREEIYKEVQRIIKEDCPILPLYQQPNIYGMRSNIEFKPVIDEMILADTIKILKK